MKNRPNFPLLACLLLVSVLCALLPAPARALTQQDWMVALVDALGRSFGLPDHPQPADYINILSGQRNVRFEAEAVRAPEDEVAVMTFANYGEFSGSGWLLGGSSPTEVHMRVLLPLDGDYRLSVALRGAGATVRTRTASFSIDGRHDTLTRVDVGSTFLAAGQQEITVTLPPGGALDYLELTAPALTPLQPDGGWQPAAPLDWQTLTTTAVAALELAGQLPAGTPALAIEAEQLPEPADARVVEAAHLGAPSGGKWLRAGGAGTRITVPVKLAGGGFFDLAVTALGAPLHLAINRVQEFTFAGPPYLDTITLGPFHFSSGDNQLEVALPPGGGLDRIVLTPRRSDPATLAGVLGMDISAEAPVSADLDALTSRLAAAATAR